MNICLLTLEWPPVGGGIGTYMYNLSRGLVQLGHEVSVVTHDRNPLEVNGVTLIKTSIPDIKKTFFSKIQKWKMEPFYTWSKVAYCEFVEAHKRKPFNILETAEYGAWSWFFRGKVSVPIVIKCHTFSQIIWAINNSGFGKHTRPLWLIFQDIKERNQVYHASALSAPSYSLANYVSIFWQIERSKIQVIPNPIDTDLFRPNDNHDDTNVKTEILFVGRFQYNKGVFDFSHAMKDILSKYPSVTIRMIGQDVKCHEKYSHYGVMASDAIMKIIPVEFHERICVMPFIAVDKLIEYYRQALCAVMPTRGFESFSYTVLESMSCGCPVITTHCGGPSEIIKDKSDGLLVEPGDVMQLVSSISSLIVERDFREKLAINARKKVLTKYSIPVVVPSVLALYGETIKHQRNL